MVELADLRTDATETNYTNLNKLHLSRQEAISRQLHWIMNEEIIIEDIIAKEAHDHPGRDKDRNAMVSGYETTCRHPCFNCRDSDIDSEAQSCLRCIRFSSSRHELF